MSMCRLLVGQAFCAALGRQRRGAGGAPHRDTRCPRGDMAPGARFHGDTYEFWPRFDGQDNLGQLGLPINLDTVTCAKGDGSVAYGPRPLYPHVHLLPTYEYFVVSCK